MSGDPINEVLRYEPAPLDNPLKGLVPYAGNVTRFFPHSMEFNYLPLSALVRGLGQYDWRPLEALLDDIASRGHQTVFRLYLEYPGKKNSIPAYLLRDGLTVHQWANTDDGSKNETPDYQNTTLRKLLIDFIAALGRRYDGDKRIGFITAGLLGLWGEWHTYPRTDLWASKDVQRDVMDAYASAFKITPVLLRYPVAQGDSVQAANAQLPFGYHDDSFAWATLDTGRKEDDWFFVPALRRAGAADKWKRFPVGGEIRPEAWGKVFDASTDVKEIQNFERCVRETHASWLMDSGMFRENTLDRRVRAQEQVRRMGYEFHIPRTLTTFAGTELTIRTEVVNRGIAPFYYDWPITWRLLDENSVTRRAVRGKQSLLHLLPGDRARVWEQKLSLANLPTGLFRGQARVVNPLPNGKPLEFANKERVSEGWITLCTFFHLHRKR